ncbi:MAG: DUF4124 domain-containing protein, partial [Halofilum sp. (in: g-proteobacteria)]
MNLTRPCLLAVAALLPLIPATAMAEVYKWVDEDGVTHYSQEPPPEGTPTVITPVGEAPSSAEDDADADGQDDDADGEDGDGDKARETISDFCKD